jgi:hypothetical protein
VRLKTGTQIHVTRYQLVTFLSRRPEVSFGIFNNGKRRCLQIGGGGQRNSPPLPTHAASTPIHQLCYLQIGGGGQRSSPPLPTHAASNPIHQLCCLQIGEGGQRNSPSLPTHAASSPIHQLRCFSPTKK